MTQDLTLIYDGTTLTVADVADEEFNLKNMNMMNPGIFRFESFPDKKAILAESTPLYELYELKKRFWKYIATFVI